MQHGIKQYLHFRLVHVLFLLLVISVGCAWLRAKYAKSLRQRTAVATIEQQYPFANVRYDFEKDEDGTQWNAETGEWNSLSPPSLLGKYLGIDLVHSTPYVFWDSDKVEVPDADIVLLRDLSGLESVWLKGPWVNDQVIEMVTEIPSLRYLTLTNTTITDEGMRHIGNCEQLETLKLDIAIIGDAGLAPIRKLHNLHHLALSQTSISDDGLSNLKNLIRMKDLRIRGTDQVSGDGLIHLRNLVNLERLALDGTSVEDKHLLHLHRLTKLKELDLSNTKVTKDAKSQLEAHLPDCTVWIENW